MPKIHSFQFGNHTCNKISGTGRCSSTVIIQERFSPSVEKLLPGRAVLIVCDENSHSLIREQALFQNHAVLVLPQGEKNKNWPAVESILRTAGEKGLGRDGLFIGFGGGVVCDCTAFAASIYMRGASLALIPTTLLCMVDASLGGKAGFDLDGLKNLAGSFYPAETILVAAEALKTLPRQEWKSGMAELIKLAVLDPGFFKTLQQPGIAELKNWVSGPESAADSPPRESGLLFSEQILPLIEKAILVKGRMVEKDFRETDDSGGRALLNLGHSFGHALESALGPGTWSHGEAVTWGIARACELGQGLGITPPDRAKLITQTLSDWGFKIAVNASGSTAKLGANFKAALFSDKKKKNGKLRFVVPDTETAVLIEQNNNVTQYLDSLCAEL